MKKLLVVLYLFLNIALCASNSTLVEATGNSIALPIFGPKKITYLEGEEIVALLRPILRDRLQKVRYDRIFASGQYIQHMLEHPEMRDPLDALRLLKFDVLEDDGNLLGGPCVGLTFDLMFYLPQSIQGYICASVLPKKFQQLGFPKYCHTAILIAYENPFNAEDHGYVLLDPSFDLAEPILLKSSRTVCVYDIEDKGLWEFNLKEDKVICQIHPNHGDIGLEFFQMHYRTDELLNPVESSALPMILADRRLSFLSRDSDGVQLAHLNVELDRKRIIWDVPGKRFEPVSFSELINGWKFPNCFCEQLQISSEQLQQKLLNIILHQDFLDNLYLSYLLKIKELGDYSITGEIDEKQMSIISRLRNSFSLSRP